MPAIAASVTVAMTAENAQIAATDPAFAQPRPRAEETTAMTHVSNEIKSQTQPVRAGPRRARPGEAIGTKLDQQLLEGTGTAPQIRGLRNQSGILATSLATNGRAPTIDDVADAIGRMEGRNANCTAIIMSPRTWATYRKVADTTSRYQLSPDPSIDGTKSLFGVPVFTSSQISTSETSGTNSDCSWIGFVDTARWIVARRKEVELAYSPHFKFDYDQVSIRAIARFDAGLIDTASAELITGVRP
ncbi:MAG: phage major capsid protein [Acidimicrobiia bacterium]